jgi:hypothetical protein
MLRLPIVKSLGIALAVASLTNVVTFCQWRSVSAALVEEKAAHVKTIEIFKTAQREADVRAQAIRDTLTKEAKADAKRADESYASLLTKYRASLVRYQANQGSSSGPSPSNNPTPESGNGPSASPQLPEAITISMNDAQICAINTARLQTVRDWTQTLSKE